MTSPAPVATHPDAPRPAATPRLGYQPALDGLRAIAVVLVLLYHGGVGWASGGFLGVDVFFVLSGFLISWLLVDEHARTGAISIGAFYGRRARRLLPAVTLVLVAVVVYAATLAPESTLPELRGDVLATIGYVTNWRLVLQDRGYFDAFTVPSPLKHTWSLALEEQWYLVWPLVLAGLLALGRRTRRRLGPALVATAALCLASAAWAAALHRPGGDPSRVYYGTDTRAHELLAGAVLAIVLAMAGRFELPRRAVPVADGLGVLALAWVLWLAATVDDRTEWLYEGGLLALSIAVAIAVVAILQPPGLLHRALAVAPLRLVGQLSYGLYLWHFPLYVVLSSTRTGLSGSALLALRLAGTAALSGASYVLVERPARDRRRSLRRLLTATSAGLLGTVAAMSLVVVVAAPDAPAPSALPARPGTTAPTAGPGSPPGSGADGDFFDYDPSDNPPPTTVPGDDAVRVLMTGESVSLTLSYGYEQRSSTPPVLLWDKSVVGCSLFAGERTFESTRTDGGPQCAAWRDDRARWLRAFHPQVVAVLSGVWETYDKVVDGEPLEFGSEGFDRWFSRSLDDLVEQLGGDGATVVLLTTPCNQRAEGITGSIPPENRSDRVDHLNDLYRAAAARHPGQVEVIDLHGFVCPDGRYTAERDGVRFRSDDGVHFSPEGAELVRRWLYPQLAALAEPGS
ncbi:MAG TPA: acyltransferase family protein [Acidimicrobiales bacterium]|nr:acyltransferase family protein [Acidimicrobiales bacterium]